MQRAWSDAAWTDSSRILWPVLGSGKEAQSPIAYTSGSCVCNLASTRMPLSIARPAARASSELGTTPAATRTASGMDDGAVLQAHPDGLPAVVDDDGVDAGLPQQLHARTLVMAFEQLRRDSRNRSLHDATLALDHRDVAPLLTRHGRVFQPDEAAADDDDPREARHLGPDPLRIRERAQDVDPVRVQPRNRRIDHACAGGEHELVPRQRLAGFQDQHLRFEIDPGHAGAELRGDAVLLVVVRLPDEQALLCPALEEGLGQRRPSDRGEVLVPDHRDPALVPLLRQADGQLAAAPDPHRR